MSVERRCPGNPPRMRDRNVGRKSNANFACFYQPLPGKQEDIQRTRTPEGWMYTFTRSFGTIPFQTPESVTRRTTVRMKNDSLRDVRMNPNLPPEVRKMFDA